ncbi:2,3-diketo-L-gulonate-binding periplasmic protein YiaO [subsurface metagenome]
MRMKKYIVLSLIIVVLLSSVFINVGAEATVIQIGHVHHREFPAHLALLKFAEYVEKNTNGEVKIDIFPDSALGSGAKLVERTKVGTVDASIGYSGILQQYEPSFGIFSTFFLWDDYDVMFKFFQGPVAQEMVENLAKNGLRLLGPICYSGERYLTTRNKPIYTPEDLEGMKIRSVEDVIARAFTEGMGAIPTPIAFSELYMALQQKIVDGQVNGLSQIWYQKFYEQQKYLMINNVKFTDFILVLNEAKFQTLSPENQKVLVTGANEIWAKEVKKLSMAEESVLLDQLKEKGMEVIYPDREKFKAGSKKMAYKLEKEGVWPAGLYDKVVAEIERLSK